MQKIIYVLTFYDCNGYDEGRDSTEVLSAYDSEEEAEKGMLNYYNGYIAPNYDEPIADTIEEVEAYLDELNFYYEINNIHYYTKERRK